MAETYKRIVVMYQNDVPAALTEYVGADRNLNLTKDGLQDWAGSRAFRCLIGMEWRNSFDDHGRMKDLERFLATLVSSNQILAYRVV